MFCFLLFWRVFRMFNVSVIFLFLTAQTDGVIQY